MKKTSKLIIYTASVVVLIVLAWSFLANIIISRPKWGFDYPYFDKENKGVDLLAILFVIIYFSLNIVLFALLRKYEINKKNKIITWVGAGLFLLTIILVPVATYADQGAVADIALSIVKGEFVALNKNEYLYLYPHNMGYVLFCLPFAVISYFTRITVGALAKFANVPLMALTGYLMSKIFVLIFPNKKQYSTLFLLFYISSISIITMNNLVYGDIPGLFFFTLAIYYFLKENDDKTKDYILSFAFVAVGNMFRGIGLILLIALIIHIFCQKNFKYKHLGVGVLSFAVVYFGISLFECILFAQAFPFGTNGMPVYSWIQMGLTGEVGYWTGYGILDIWKDDQLSKDEKIQMYINNIVNILKDLRFDGLINLLSRKMHYLFGEGTYQIVLYGLGEEETIHYNGNGAWFYPTFITKYLANGSLLKNTLVDYAYSWNMVALLLSFISIIKNFKKPNVLLTFFAGIIAFYCVWELKTRYIFVLLPTFILLITDIISSILEKLFMRKANV